MIDPGWRGVWREAIPLPKRLVRRWTFFQQASLLDSLRGLTISQAVFFLAISAWAAIFAASHGSLGPGAVFYLIVAEGVTLVGLGGVAFEMRRDPLEPADLSSAAPSFKRRCLLPAVIAGEATGTAAFVAFLTGWWFVAVVGALVTIVGFVVAAPTAGRIERFSHSLDRKGMHTDLLAQLVSQPPLGR